MMDRSSMVDLVEEKMILVTCWLMIAIAFLLSLIYLIAIIGGMILDERDRKRHEAVLCKLT
jgi:ABC-type Na+ efflux pump permease subunit